MDKVFTEVAEKRNAKADDSHRHFGSVLALQVRLPRSLWSLLPTTRCIDIRSMSFMIGRWSGARSSTRLEAMKLHFGGQRAPNKIMHRAFKAPVAGLRPGEGLGQGLHQGLAAAFRCGGREIALIGSGPLACSTWTILSECA